jgi:hypothetical protein
MCKTQCCYTCAHCCILKVRLHLTIYCIIISGNVAMNEVFIFQLMAYWNQGSTFVSWTWCSTLLGRGSFCYECFILCGLSKISWNINFVHKWLWVLRNTNKCLPTYCSWISVASGVKLRGWVYFWWMYFHCCVSTSLQFCDGWPERAACVLNLGRPLQRHTKCWSKLWVTTIKARYKLMPGISISEMAEHRLMVTVVWNSHQLASNYCESYGTDSARSQTDHPRPM